MPRLSTRSRLPAPAPLPVSSRPLRMGFVPLSDCAPAVAACELGLFTKHGVKVQMLRQPGWASIRDGLMAGTLDVAHAPATLVFMPGNAGMSVPLRTAFLFNTGGNAITLSTALHRRGVRDNRDLVSEVRARRGHQPLTLAAVARFSMHMVLLRRWLRNGGVDPDNDVRLVALPPGQVATCLAAGHIDGFCAGEPWNSVAVEQECGWRAASGSSLIPGLPEKALIVTQKTSAERSEDHAAMIRALQEAAGWCDSPDGRAALPGMMARPEWLGVPASSLVRGFSDPGFLTFHSGGVSEPAPDRAAALIAALRSEKLLTGPSRRDADLMAGFDHAAWQAALNLHPSPVPA